jgi:hypothetical protein
VSGTHCLVSALVCSSAAHGKGQNVKIHSSARQVGCDRYERIINGALQIIVAEITSGMHVILDDSGVKRLVLTMSSRTHSSRHNTVTTESQYRQFTNKAEFDEWVAERSKENAAGLKAAGVSIIDFNVRCV